LLAATNNVTG